MNLFKIGNVNFIKEDFQDNINDYEDIIDIIQEMQEKLDEIAEKVFERMSKIKAYGKTLTLKIKFADFELITRSKTIQGFITDIKTIQYLGQDLLNTEYQDNMKVRLLGLSISNLEFLDNGQGLQLTLDF